MFRPPHPVCDAEFHGLRRRFDPTKMKETPHRVVHLGGGSARGRLLKVALADDATLKRHRNQRPGFDPSLPLAIPDAARIRPRIVGQDHSIRGEGLTRSRELESSSGYSCAFGRRLWAESTRQPTNGPKPAPRRRRALRFLRFSQSLHARAASSGRAGTMISRQHENLRTYRGGLVGPEFLEGSVRIPANYGGCTLRDWPPFSPTSTRHRDLCAACGRGGH